MLAFLERRSFLVVALLLNSVALPYPALAQVQTMSIVKLTDQVYAAIYSEMKRDPVQSNALIIIGDDGVCVVDAHYTPTAARATLAEIRKLTRLPVRYVVTTHWHDDHVFGNQEYQRAFPGVTFVAQHRTRVSMAAQAAEHRDQLIKSYGAALIRIDDRLRTGLDREGNPLTPAGRTELVGIRPIIWAYLRDFQAVRIVLPSLTFDRELTLFLGRTEIRVLAFGPGNTPGDAVVYLPAERIVAVGDLVVYPVPFMYGGYPASWVQVMQSVRELAPAIIVPGHGPVMRDFLYFDQVTGLLQTMAAQADSAGRKALTLEQTRAVFDLTQQHDRFVAGHEDREGTFQSSIVQSGVEAAYQEAMGLPSN